MSLRILQKNRKTQRDEALSALGREWQIKFGPSPLHLLASGVLRVFFHAAAIFVSSL
jgi:hypothetical protein